MTADEDEEVGAFASPPCFLHELDPAYRDSHKDAKPKQHGDVLRWRKAERARLIQARLDLGALTRRAHDARIAERLTDVIGQVDGQVVSAYWPFRGEPNLRSFLKDVVGRGGRCALPVVVERGQPLVFRAWSPGDPMSRGIWNIPIPRDESPIVTPDIVIAPVVGFDPSCYRLGYGGGYYDRTLAALPRRPRILGVGYAVASIPTIFPQWHDIPMDLVVTEGGCVP